MAWQTSEGVRGGLRTVLGKGRVLSGASGWAKSRVTRDKDERRMMRILTELYKPLQKKEVVCGGQENAAISCAAKANQARTNLKKEP